VADSGPRPLRYGSRRWLAEAQGYVCPWCKLPLPDDLADTDRDHIIPRCRGGPDRTWNYQLLHKRCNRRGGKGTALTAEAEALAREHGVTTHIPLGDSCIADQPLTWSDSLFMDYLHELGRTPVTDTARREAIMREYLDTRKYLDELQRTA